MTNPTLHVRWQCDACREGGLMARLETATLGDIEASIDRGHARRSPTCHQLRGTRRIVYLLNGKRMRMRAPAATPQPQGGQPDAIDS